MNKNQPLLRKPDWLKVKLPSADSYGYMKAHLKANHLHTICESGNCPNQAECWEQRTATFMILGNTCTRSCLFCDVHTGKPIGVDDLEPERIADAVEQLQLSHCVLTSVTRDDLSDGGAGIWAKTVLAIRLRHPMITIETLIPDFNGNTSLLQQVIDVSPDIISHNIAQAGIRTKSGLMLGLGETPEDIYHSMDDLLAHGCEVLTLGQYLQPKRNNTPVVAYVSPEQFMHYKEVALSKGFAVVESGPLVRSSYHSHHHLR